MEYNHNKDLVPFAKQLRKNMTKEERKLWFLFLRRYPVRFLRQKIIGKYIVDFYCAKAGLVIEIDGSQHYYDDGLINDKERTVYLQSQGLEVVRFSNLEIQRNFRGVCEYIDYIVRQTLEKASSRPPCKEDANSCPP